jgi:D-glycero-D-manno-heptose 1,7-bisphosphate phosphatase
VKQQGVFIERDGILNETRVDGQYSVSPLCLADFKIRTEVVPLLARLKEEGFIIIVTTNQPGLSRGYLSRRELDRMHDFLRRNIAVDDLLVCPHDEADRCPCRRPKPGLMVEAGFKWHLDLDQSFVISDKWQDAEAARQSSCTSLLINSPWIGKGHRDFLVKDFSVAVEKIMGLKHAERAMAY